MLELSFFFNFVSAECLSKIHFLIEKKDALMSWKDEINMEDTLFLQDKKK